MLTPNNPRKRWAYVFKTYAGGDKAPILFDVALFAANLMGLDSESNRINRLSNEYMSAAFGSGWILNAQDKYRRKYSPASPADGPMAADRLRALNELMETHLPTHHKHEDLVPWFAARIAKLWPREIRRERIGVLDETYDTDIADMEWGDTINEFLRRGTAIGEWAKTNRYDLGRLSLTEALTGAVSWVEQSDRAAREGNVVHRFPDGWSVHKLTTRKQLEEEGVAMDHCIGSYSPQVTRGDVEVFSLRNPTGESLATLAWDNDDGGWEQIQGHGNERVKEETWPYIETFVEKYGPGGATPSPETAAPWFGKSSEILEEAARSGWNIYAYIGEGPLRDAGYIGSRDIDHISAARALEHGGPMVVSVPHTATGYGASLHDKANREAILEEFDENPDVFDGDSVMVNVHSSDERLLELLNLMEANYVYDDDKLSHVEMEADEEAWDSWAASDYRSGLEKLGEDEDEDDTISDAIDWTESVGLDLRSVFESARETANVYWEHDGDGRHVDIDRVVKATEPLDLMAPIFEVWSERDWSDCQPRRSQPLAKRMGEIFGAVRPPNAAELKAIITGLYEEGFQPPGMADAFDEASLEDQLGKAGLSTDAISQLAARMTPDLEREYMDLAPAWWTLQALWEVADSMEDDKDTTLVSVSRLLLDNQSTIGDALSEAQRWENYYQPPPKEVPDAAE